ncbi:MAG: hypothetical protein EXS18_03840 [Verrucomicrobiae bacterium]|nr:hypothetical protein [Verrucomicrobiae bacterium]
MKEVRITCPKCKTPYDVPENYLGQSTNCNECKHEFVIQQAFEMGTTVLSADSTDNQTTPIADSSSDVPVLRPPEESVPAIWNVDDVILDLYEVKQVHEGGGMGIVYRVHHRQWNIDLAVKSPRPEYFTSEADKENFENECETWVKLGMHPNTVSCYYVRRLGGIPRVFAEYVEGGSLHDWIASSKVYEGGHDEALKRLIDIAIQFAWGLHYAHEQGLIHQDVKPANVMMSIDGSAKVTDFGLAQARLTASESSDRGEAGKSVVVAGVGLMTKEYASPEQAEGRPLTRKTDIWSWAVSVLEMFTGEITWPSGTVAAAFLETLLQSGTANGAIPRIPEPIVELLRRCFQDDSTARPADMMELAASLRCLHEQITGLSFPRPEPRPADALADDLNNRALSLLDLGQEEKAEKCWEEALKADPHHMETTYNLGVARWRRGLVTVEELLAKLGNLKPLVDELWKVICLMARVHLESDDCESAIQLLQSLTGGESAQEEVQRLLSEARRRQATSRRCVRTFEEEHFLPTPSSVCLSPDGRYALTGRASITKDRMLKWWDIQSGKCLRVFDERHDEGITSLALSDDCRYALSTGTYWMEDEMAALLTFWDVRTGIPLRDLEGHGEEEIRAVALSRDGRYALSAGSTLKYWDTTTGQCLRTFKFEKMVSSVCMTSDDQFALTGSDSLQLWELGTGRCLRTFGDTGYITTLSLSADNRYVLSAGETVKLWEVGTGNCLRTFKGHSKKIHWVCLSPDGCFGLLDGPAREFEVWEVTSGRCLHSFHGHTDSVVTAALTADGRYCLSGSRDGTLKLWDVMGNGTSYQTPLEWAGLVTSQKALDARSQYQHALSEAQKVLVSQDVVLAARWLRTARAVPGCERRKEALAAWMDLYLRLPRKNLVRAWEAPPPEELPEHEKWVALTGDGRFALSKSDRYVLRVREADTGRCLRTVEGHDFVCLSSDGRYALSRSSDNLKTIARTAGSYTFTTDSNQTLSAWEVATGESLFTVAAPSHLSDIY